MNPLTRSQCVVTCVVLLAAIFALIVPAPAQAGSAEPTDQWKFSITPYLWLPNINGMLKYSIPPGAAGSPDVETGPNDYLQNLQSVVMLSGEVRKDRWSVFTDVIYLAFIGEDSSVKEINFGSSIVGSSLNLGTTSSLRGTAWTLGTGYAVRTGSAATIDVFGGLRYFDLSASTSWHLALDVPNPGGGQSFPRDGGISQSVTLWDGIIGARGRVGLGKSDWSIPYYFDVGGGSSSMTWQGMIGIACSFNWGSMTLDYRNLYYDQKDDKLIQNLRFNGPAVGATFRF